MSEVLLIEDNFDEDEDDSDEQLKIEEISIIILDYLQLLKNINNDKNNKFYKQLLIENTKNNITQKFPPENCRIYFKFYKIKNEKNNFTHIINDTSIKIFTRRIIKCFICCVNFLQKIKKIHFLK